MDEKIYMRICSMELDNEAWSFCDCNGVKLKSPSKERYFSSAMKMNYLDKRKGRKDIATVWILVGINNEGEETCIQVARTKDLINSLNEIRENVKDFFFSRGKYGFLRTEKYTQFVFYEVNIDNYLSNDKKMFIEMYGEVPKNEYFSLAYYYIRAAYVEGKLGFETKALMYNKSSLDEYYYLFYQNKECEVSAR